MRRIVGLLIAVFLVAVAIPAIADDEDAARHRPATDSSSNDVSDDSLCVDDDTTSCYNSGRGAPVWVQVDFGVEVPLKLVRLIPSMYPDGVVNVQVLGVTSSGITYALGSFSGTAHEHKAINIPILFPIPVRYLKVNVVGSCSWVAFYSIQAIKTDGTTSVMHDTWGRLKALYK